MNLASQTIHGGVFVIVFLLISLAFADLRWPWFLLLPIAAYLALVLAIPALRRTMRRVQVGRIDWRTVSVGLLISVAATASLISYEGIFQPDVTSLAERLPAAAFGTVLLFGIVFSVVNAAMEE